MLTKQELTNLTKSRAECERHSVRWWVKHIDLIIIVKSMAKHEHLEDNFTPNTVCWTENYKILDLTDQYPKSFTTFAISRYLWKIGSWALQDMYIIMWKYVYVSTDISAMLHSCTAGASFSSFWTRTVNLFFLIFINNKLVYSLYFFILPYYSGDTVVRSFVWLCHWSGFIPIGSMFYAMCD